MITAAKPIVEITPEMIEAGARAIREKFGARSGFVRGFCRPLPWDALPPTLRDSYRGEALAVLSAALAVRHR
jgi:hypothetical protein